MATTDRFNSFTVNMYQDDEGDHLTHFVQLPSVSAFAATPEESLMNWLKPGLACARATRSAGNRFRKSPARREYGVSFNIRDRRRDHRVLVPSRRKLVCR